MQTPNPDLYYTQPTFRRDDPDFLEAQKHAKSKSEDWTLDSPGMKFRLVVDYYRFEAFATERARDARCGQTGHRGIRYAPATLKDLKINRISIDQIACGHDVDHPHFEEVLAPLFDAAMRRLLQEIAERDQNAQGEIASTEILIARTRYSISAEAIGDFIKFPISALTVFEKANDDVMDRTIAWLQNRLTLVGSPSLFDAVPS